MTTQHSGHVFMGVDPGAKGSMVTVGSCTGCDTTELLNTIRFSQHTEVQIWREFHGIAEECAEMDIPLTAILEKCSIRPGIARSRGGPLMASYGLCKGYLVAAGIRFIEVTPAVWTLKLGRRDPKKTKPSVKKQRNLALAQQLYPDRHIIQETAEAFLLAEYGRRFHQ